MGHWRVFNRGTQYFTQVFLAAYGISDSTCSFLRKTSEHPRTASQVLGAGTVLQAGGRRHRRRTCLGKTAQPDPAIAGVSSLLSQIPPAVGLLPPSHLKLLQFYCTAFIFKHILNTHFPKMCPPTPLRTLEYQSGEHYVNACRVQWSIWCKNI